MLPRSVRFRRRLELARGAVIAALLLLGACMAPPWDLEALERRNPGLARMGVHRLGDVTPYVLPRGDSLLWFLCRWDTSRPLRTSLPEDASPRERQLLLRALASWESAGLGLRFEATDDSASAEIEISIGGIDEGKSGQTFAECAVSARDGGFSARLVRAAIWLSRTQQDFRGHEIAFSDAEWLGGAVHELGHALGFQGHARRGPGPMVRDVDEVRWIGRHLLEGRELQASTLRALYAVKSGAMLARVPLPPGRTEVLDRLGRIAEEQGYRGPFVRVGEQAASIAWWSRAGRSVGVRLPGIRSTLRDATKLEIEPDLLAQAWLGPHPD